MCRLLHFVRDGPQFINLLSISVLQAVLQVPGPLCSPRSVCRLYRHHGGCKQALAEPSCPIWQPHAHCSLAVGSFHHPGWQAQANSVLGETSCFRKPDTRCIPGWHPAGGAREHTHGLPSAGGWAGGAQGGSSRSALEPPAGQHRAGRLLQLDRVLGPCRGYQRLGSSMQFKQRCWACWACWACFARRTLALGLGSHHSMKLPILANRIATSNLTLVHRCNGRVSRHTRLGGTFAAPGVRQSGTSGRQRAAIGQPGRPVPSAQKSREHSGLSLLTSLTSLTLGDCLLEGALDQLSALRYCRGCSSTGSA
jgi:hypothetical protein